MLLNIIHSIWQMLLASSLYLLFGFTIAGLIHVFLPQKFIEKHLKKPGFLSVLKSSAFGIPLPLCSCSVIPVGLSLRKNGASKGATASFFVSTPEVGVDSFLLSYALLGPFIAVARVIVSFFSALGIGFAVESLAGNEDENLKLEVDSDDEPKSCCASRSSCHTEEDKQEIWWKKALRFSFVEILDDISVILTIGFIVGGIISAAVPADFFVSLNLGTYGTMLLMLLVSLPVYVCATSSTPIAAALLLKGVGPGAVLVFLLAGPATNITTILVLIKELGKKAAAIYVLGIVVISFVSGVLFEKFIFSAETSSKVISDVFEHQHDMLHQVAAVVFVLVVSFSLYKKLLAKKAAKDCCSQ